MSDTAAQTDNNLKEKAVELGLALLWQLCIPLAVMFAVKHAWTAIKGYIDSLYVEGKPDEWVLILNNGQMKKAEVGLRAYKGPFDQVARFPSKVNKVDFACDQVTQEMQGVQVRGMLIWSINRSDSGPFKAYQNLGADLATNNPRTANDNLCQQASSIVRNVIANSTLMNIMRDRKKIRDVINKDMQKVCAGWGVWLETVEITEVIISSASLFKDLQADFREKMHQEAELIKMEVDAELNKFKEQQALEMSKITQENRAEQDNIKNLSQLEIKDMQEKGRLEQAVIIEEKAKMNNELQIYLAEQTILKDKRYKELKNAYSVADLDDDIKRANQKAEVDEAYHQIELLQNENKQALEREKANYAIEKQKLDANVLKDNLDKNLMLAKALKAGVNVFSSMYVNQLKYTSIDNTNTTAVLAQAFAGFNEVSKAIKE